MKQSLSMEFYKAKHSHMWILPLIFIGIIFLWMGFSTKNLSPEDLAIGYTNAFYQLPLLNSIIMPLMLAVLVSRLCDMEAKGDTLKLLYTLQSRHTFYNSKFIHESFYLLLFVLGECLVLLYYGISKGYTDTPRITSFLWFALPSFVTGLAILTLQHLLSLVFTNQVVPLFMGLAGSFLGMFSLYMPPAVSNLILYSYFAQFVTSKMNWDQETREMWYTPVAFPAVKFVVFLFFAVFFYWICEQIFTKKEV